MEKIAASSIVILLLISCEREFPIAEKKSVSAEITKSEKNISERFLRIDGQNDTLRNFELGKNLYGKFHQDRAEFYIIENPNKTIYGHPVKSITLYFLDGMLAKTKFELDEDITDDLIQSYGTFTITGFDSVTRKLFKTEKVIHNLNQRKVLNKNLLNYELKWEVPSKLIYTRVDKSGPRKRFEYVETMKNYDSKYKRIEML